MEMMNSSPWFSEHSSFDPRNDDLPRDLAVANNCNFHHTVLWVTLLYFFHEMERSKHYTRVRVHKASDLLLVLRLSHVKAVTSHVSDSDIPSPLTYVCTVYCIYIYSILYVYIRMCVCGRKVNLAI